ncbi:MAG: AAA family ATPase [Caldilineales bacterium]|nr:AAA family ATPase [Caldilineales bacterium]
MTTTIALAGKGGVGKTTIAALIIRYLMQTQTGPILAIDADPSSNLNMALGLDLGWTVGDIRENILSEVQKSLTAGGAAMGTLPGAVTKREYLDYEIRAALAEGDRFDLIAMGRSEGPGCYCAVNHNLREVVDAISRNYRYVVIDNEAGLEHLSRRTTRDVDYLFVISDPSQRGLVAAQRIGAFRHEMNIDIRRCYLILNRAPGSDLPPALRSQIEAMDFPLLGVAPADPLLMELDMAGRAVIEVDGASPSYAAVAAMMAQVLGQ